jgi:hypothetical protein
MFNLFNFLAYQVAWFAVVIGAARGYAWAGAAIALVVAAVHLARRPAMLEYKLIGAAVLLGLIVDTTLVITGQVRFDAGGNLPIAPYWMLSLWIAFATTLNHSLRWLMLRPATAALLGAVGGPLAYFAGAKLGALSLSMPTTTLALIAVLWAATMVVLSWMVTRQSALPHAHKVPA